MKTTIFFALLLNMTAAFANPGVGTFDTDRNGSYSCHEVDTYGRRLENGRLSSRHCTAGYATFDTDGNGAYSCHAVDRHGRRLENGRVSNRHCQGHGVQINGPYDDSYDRRDDRRDDCGIDELGRPIYNGYYNCR